VLDRPGFGAPRPGASSLVGEYRQALAALREITQDFESRVRRLERSVQGAEAATGIAEGAAELEVRCLGSFELRLNGERLDLPASGRPLTVLKVLADRGGRPTPREVLVEALWPGIATDAGANRLRVAIHALRKHIEVDTDIVSFEQGHYLLNATSIEIDAERFEELVTAGSASERAGQADAALQLYEQAADLYRGDYFEDEPYEDWPLLRRQHLRDLYLNLVVKLAVLALERGDYDACIMHCHEIVRQDDCSEDAYRLLMLAHGLRGNRARALRWYDLCVKTLARELNVEPSAATQQLRTEILNEPLDDGRRSVRQRLGLGIFAGLGAAFTALSMEKAAVAAALLIVSVVSATAAGTALVARHDRTGGTTIAEERAARPSAVVHGELAASATAILHPPLTFDIDVLLDAKPGDPAPTSSEADPVAAASPLGSGPDGDVEPAKEQKDKGNPANPGAQHEPGPPEGAGPPDSAGPPEWAGPQENAGPADAIVSAIQELGIGGVAMGTRGKRSRFAKALLGSCAEDVVRRSNVPVLIVKEGTVAGVPEPS